MTLTLTPEDEQIVRDLIAEEAFNTVQLSDGEFHITDEESANFIVTKIASYEAERKAIMEAARARCEVLERKEAYLTYKYGQELELFALSQIEKAGGKTKTYTLPSGGKLSFRTLKEAVEVAEDGAEKLLGWVKQNLPAALKVTESLAKTVVNEFFSTTGQIPDGCIYRPESQKFYIQAPKDKD